MTVRLRLVLTLAAMSFTAILTMVLLFVATTSLLDELRYSTGASLRASAAYGDLARSLAEQETGVSGFVLTGNTDFRDQYYNGAADEAQLYEWVDGTLGGDNAIDGAFRNVHDAMVEWRIVYAIPTIGDLRLGRDEIARSFVRQQAGKALFDKVRAGSAALNELMTAPDAELNDRLASLAATRLAMFAASVLAILVVLVIGVKLTRDWISRPLRTLVATARRVEEGEDVRFLTGRRDEIGDLGAALERMRHRIVAGQQAAELAVEHSTVLNAFTELTGFTETDVQVSEALLGAISELIHPQGAVVHVTNRSNDRAVPEATSGRATAEVLPLRALDNCPGVRRGTLYVTPDVAQPLAVRCPVQRSEQGTVACLPLAALGETIGAVHLVWDEADAMPHDQRATLSRIAEHAALSIGNRRLVRALQGMANTDARTGLPNSRAFDEAVENILATREADAPEAIVLLDLDHFKQFNDRYGHPGGDEALRAFAGILRSSIGDGDIAARYGGEEFAIHLRGLGRDGALDVAERIRSRVEAAILTLGPGITGRITASLGVAIAPADGSDRISLLRAADSALYVAKANGRNRVATTADAPLAPVPLTAKPALAS
jgi:diguanylate cyclase (GGDEF)-like protein